MPVLIPLDRIQDSPFQTRQHYDEASIESLADSIERGGLDQVPKGRLVSVDGKPLVRQGSRSWTTEPAADGVGLLYVLDADYGSERRESYVVTSSDDVARLLRERPGFMVQLAFGHRRLRAFRLIEERRRGDQVAAADGIGGGIPVGYMPVELHPLTDEEMFAKAITENHQREDISAVEEAEAMQAAIDRFGWTHETIGERFGYSRSAVSNKLRLLKLPEEVRALNLDGTLSEAKCRALVAAYDSLAEHPGVADGTWPHPEPHPRTGNGFVVGPIATIVSTARRVESAAELREFVAHYVEARQAEADRREAERKRREEPELFEGEATEAKEAPDISAEIERINDAHNKAILWVKDPSFIRAADDDVLTRTLAKLRPLVRQVESIIEDGRDRSRSAEDVIEHGRDLDRIAGGIRYDIDRVSREIDRRKPADSFDDGGEGLNRISEAQGMPPIEPPTSAETAAPEEPTQEQVDAWEAEWKALETAARHAMLAVPTPARRIIENLLPCAPPADTSGDGWATAFTAAILRELYQSFDLPNAREAAEAWGIEVDWPDTPPNLNQRERKLYRAVSEATDAGEALVERPSDEGAAQKLLDLGHVERHEGTGGLVVAGADVSAETSAKLTPEEDEALCKELAVSGERPYRRCRMCSTEFKTTSCKHRSCTRCGSVFTDLIVPETAEVVA